MVHVLDVSRDAFQKMTQNKKIVCFGMGKCFARFVGMNPEVKLFGIVDNYKYREVRCFEIENQKIPVWSPEEFYQHMREDIVVVITALAIEEMVDQLDAIERMDGICCFVEAALDDYKGIGAEKKKFLIGLMKRLTDRTPEKFLRENYGLKNLENRRKRYQIWEYISKTDTAGSKAREDVRDIAGEMGYQILRVHCGGGKLPGGGNDSLVMEEWKRHYDFIPDKSFLLMQGPIGARLPKEIMLRLKRERQVRFLYWIHDIEVLRKMGDSEIGREEFRDINEIGDVFIVHNDRMRQFYIDAGIEDRKLISLQIFDYLSIVENEKKKFEKSFTIAGNLALEKSRYLMRLNELKTITIHLYGPNFSEDVIAGVDNILYHGSVASNVIGKKLDRGFGLVWDGDSIDTCSGNTGEYLRYNNPHKLSLYLSAGLPVIIWKEAAESDFVLKNKVGLAVNSLQEAAEIINSISEEEYYTLVNHAEALSRLLKAGSYTHNAIKKAEEVLKL